MIDFLIFFQLSVIRKYSCVYWSQSSLDRNTDEPWIIQTAQTYRCSVSYKEVPLGGAVLAAWLWTS